MPQYAMCFAGFPHQIHLSEIISSSSIRHLVAAPPVTYFTSPSHSGSPHQQAFTKPRFAWNFSFISSIVVAVSIWLCKKSFALSYISCCSCSKMSRNFVAISSRDTTIFSRLSRRTTTTWFFSISFGPISIRVGIP